MLCVASASQAETVEELTFRVDPAAQTNFLKNDAEIWTATLAQQPGYLGKETWIASDPPDEIKMIIRWRSRQDWNAVPKDMLAETDARFKQAMGDAEWRMVRGRAFFVSESSSDGLSLSVDELLSTANLGLARVVEVSDDPVYGGAKRFLAVPIFGSIFNLVQSTPVEGDLDIVFDCADNYASRVDYAVMLPPLNKSMPWHEQPWLAFRDLDAVASARWVSDGSGPPPEKMGKAYVVWPYAKDRDGLSWPYAVERIRIERRPAAAK